MYDIDDFQRKGHQPSRLRLSFLSLEYYSLIILSQLKYHCFCRFILLSPLYLSSCRTIFLFLLSLLGLFDCFVDCLADCNNRVIKVLLKSVSKNRRSEGEGNEWDELLSFCFGSFRWMITV